jgi:hypothetical protein
MFNVDYYRGQCDEVFGTIPDVAHTNALYGGDKLKGSNIYFTNGDEDGWKWASIRELPEGSPMKAEVIVCDDCSHCVDLKGEKETDSENLKKARQNIRAFFSSFLKRSIAEVSE